jgi:aryl-alcohol dehydrogenase-like predicted oxidoreductase
MRRRPGSLWPGCSPRAEHLSIPGTREVGHLLENLGARNVRLTAADVQEIETSLSTFPVYGDRMGEAHMSPIDYTV